MLGLYHVNSNNGSISLMSDAKYTLTVRAPHPSLMTLEGTNSYIVDCENGEAICIDPGPAIERHVQALLDAARDRNLRISLIAVTHNHPDHWPAAPMLAHATGARIAMPDSVLEVMEA